MTKPSLLPSGTSAATLNPIRSVQKRTQGSISSTIITGVTFFIKILLQAEVQHSMRRSIGKMERGVNPLPLGEGRVRVSRFGLTSPLTRRATRSERHSRDNLTRSRLRARAVDPIHISVTAGQAVLNICDRWRGGVGACQDSNTAATELDGFRTGQKQPVEHVVEFRADFELHIAFAVDEEIAAQAQGFGRLPLPAVIVEVRRRGSERAGSRVHPGVR